MVDSLGSDSDDRRVSRSVYLRSGAKSDQLAARLDGFIEWHQAKAGKSVVLESKREGENRQDEIEHVGE
jgi:hypothetical protein